MILLDTHVLLWTLAHPDHLGSRTRAAMREASGVYYSAVSIAEVTIKVMLGRLAPPRTWPLQRNGQDCNPCRCVPNMPQPSMRLPNCSGMSHSTGCCSARRTSSGVAS